MAWEPIWLDGEVVGWCTCGGYSHFTGKCLAQGFLPTARAVDGTEVEIEILGERRPARVHLTPLFRCRWHTDAGVNSLLHKYPRGSGG